MSLTRTAFYDPATADDEEQEFPLTEEDVAILRAPEERAIEDLLEDNKKRVTESKSRAKARDPSGYIQEVDARGVRGAQERKTLTPEQIVYLQRTLGLEDTDEMLLPYRRERGIDLGREFMTTSWVDNVAFDFSIRSDSAPIELFQHPARRFVTTSDMPIQRMMQDNGMRSAYGGEYAVFSYALRTVVDPLIRSAPKLVLDIEATATFGQVTRDFSSLGLFRIDMALIHPILINTDFNGITVVQTPRFPVEVYKEQKTRSEAPFAEVLAPNVRYTFRYSPDRAAWELVFVDWWFRLAHVYGQSDGDSRLYWRAEIDVNGETLDPQRAEVFMTIDPFSSAIDSDFSLQIYPSADTRTRAPLPLFRGESIAVRLFVSNKIVPATRLASGVVQETRWLPVPEMSFEEKNTSELVRRLASPLKRNTSVTAKVTRPRNEVSSGNDNEIDLRVDKAKWNFVLDDSPTGDNLYALDSVTVGPFELAAIYDYVNTTSPSTTK